MCGRFTKSYINCALYGDASIVDARFGITIALGLGYKPVEPDNVVDAGCREHPRSTSAGPRSTGLPVGAAIYRRVASQHEPSAPRSAQPVLPRADTVVDYQHAAVRASAPHRRHAVRAAGHFATFCSHEEEVCSLD